MAYPEKNSVYASGADDAVGKGEGFYWKYESFLKKLDSRLYSIVGAAGRAFQHAHALYIRLFPKISYSTTSCSRCHFVQMVMLYVMSRGRLPMEKGSLSIKDEMERKIRISAGGFQAMAYLKKLFNVFRYPILSFQYISHRVLRWTLCPIALVVLLRRPICLVVWRRGVWLRLFCRASDNFLLTRLCRLAARESQS